MGRKRKTSGSSPSRSRKKTQKNVKTISTDMLGGFLVVFGLIYFVFLVFNNIGSFAEFIKIVSFGILGKAAFLIPVILIIVGCYAITSDTKIKVSKEIKKGILIMFLLTPVIYSFTSTNFNLFDNIVKYTVDAFNEGVGGAIGALIAGVSVKFIGILATKILFIFLTFIAVLCTFNISFNDLFNMIKNLFVSIFNGLSKIFNILFRNDEEDENEVEEDFVEEDKKLTRKQRKQLEREALIKEKMKEKGNENPDEVLRVDKSEQIEFDFNKLGGKPSQEEIQAKQQRDEFFKKQKEQKEDKNIKEVLTLDHTSHVTEDNYEFPKIEFLNPPKDGQVFDKKSIQNTAIKLQKTLASFGVEAKVTNVTKGPTVTRYELTPSTGVKVSKIVNLSDDIALNLAAKSIRIEAPIPGKAAVGIEIPNAISESVSLREVIESKEFKNHPSKVAFALGKDAAGDIIIADIAKMPHTLVAGATGSGKSVCINSILVSILYKAKPSEVKLILVDPKMVELSGYNGIPHLLIPVVTDPKKAAGALNWAVQEMVNRYNLFASKGVKDIKGYNKVVEKEKGVKLPQIVIIIDELADLMMVAPNDVEDAICRLAQMARAAGMHLIIATQRPSVDVITGIIKANIPSRIAFTVSSQVDSRTILDCAGAEKLLGKGDMLYMPVGQIKPLRVQGAFVSESEIEKIVDYIKETSGCTDNLYNQDIIESIEKANVKDGKDGNTGDGEDDADPILNDAIDLVVDMGSASASMLQRRFKIGYSRAGRIVDQMEARGLISGYDGSKPRQVLISKNEWQELKMGVKPVTEQNNVEEMVDSKNDVINETDQSNLNYETQNELAKAEVARLEKQNKSKYNIEL